MGSEIFAQNNSKDTGMAILKCILKDIDNFR